MPRPDRPGFTQEEVSLIRERLLAFFDTRARALPWRERREPYAVWVSEVMLQQTRVETVIGYYRRWMERFPTLRALAEADREEVLEAWAGLGYYSRARNLHAAAAVIRDRFGGDVPGSVEGLRELPGVGAYTAGAVASIAFGAVEPAVDGNAKRVLARLRDLPRPSPATLDRLARELVDPARPGDFNQAVMELGATVCTPRAPACEECPVSSVCRAAAEGTQMERTGRRESARAPRSERFEVDVWVDRGPPARALLVRNPEDGLLGGMWGLPASTGGGEGPGPPAVRHRFTHIEAEYVPSLKPIGGPEEGPDPAGFAGREIRWLAEEEMAGAALPVATRKILAASFRALSR